MPEVQSYKNKFLGIVLILCLFNTPAHAWWTKVFSLLDDVAKTAAKQSDIPHTKPNLFESVKPHFSGNNTPLHALRRENGKVFAKDIDGREILIASSAMTDTVAGVLTLTDQGLKFIKTVDLLIAEADLPELGDLLKKITDLAPQKSMHFVRQDGSLGRILTRQSQGKPLLMAEKHPSVFIEVSGHLETLSWALQQSVELNDLKVISLLHETDADVLRGVDRAVGSLHQPKGHQSLDDIIDVIKAEKRKTLFVIGHIEDEYFVIRDAAGNLQQKIPLAELEAAAETADTTLIMLGCSAGLTSPVSGFIAAVNALDVVAGLKQAIYKRTLGEILSALAGKSGDILIRPDIIDSVRIRVKAEHHAENVHDEALSVARFSTLSQIRAKELSDRIIPMLPSQIQYLYIFGWLLLMFSKLDMLSNWANYRRPPPRFGYQPFICLTVRGLRLFGLLLFIPFAVLLYFTVWLFPWFMTLGTILTISPLVCGIGGFIGWRYWRQYASTITDDGWLKRYWVISVFCALAGYATEFGLTQFRQFDWFSQLDEPVINYGLTSLIALILSLGLFALFRMLKYNPNLFLNATLTAPIWTIERFVNFLMHKTEEAEHG